MRGRVFDGDGGESGAAVSGVVVDVRWWTWASPCWAMATVKSVE